MVLTDGTIVQVGCFMLKTPNLFPGEERPCPFSDLDREILHVFYVLLQRPDLLLVCFFA